jgi:hypothetical protein
MPVSDRNKISERLAAARPKRELSADVVLVFGTPETFSAGAYKLPKRLQTESYFPLSASDRFVVGTAAGSELSFETGVPLLANPGGGRGVDVAWEGSVGGATGVPLGPSPVLDSL